MSEYELIVRKIAVFLSGIIYWSGVYINARRIKRRIGKSPNLKPSNLKESLLWSCWAVIIAGWISQPFFINVDSILFSFISELSYRYSIYAGVILLIAGYAGTLWCYVSMGDAWRIGIDKKDQTPLIQKGPYHYIRHPIYLFQIVMLLGVIFLLPTRFSIFILLIHFIAVIIKSSDEEAYLLNIHGEKYRDYYLRTGRFLPRLRSNKNSSKY